MGRRKIAMEKIESLRKRRVTFSKRHKGLFKKAADLCHLSNAQIAIVTFSPGGKPYSFGHSSVDDVLAHYLNGTTPTTYTNTCHDSGSSSAAAPLIPVIKESEESKRAKPNERKEGFWWHKIQQVDVDETNSIAELRKMKSRLEKLRDNVLKKLGEIAMARKDGTTSGTTADEKVIKNNVKVLDSAPVPVPTLLYLRDREDSNVVDNFKERCSSDSKLAEFMNDLPHLNSATTWYPDYELEQLLRDDDTDQFTMWGGEPTLLY